MYLDESGDDPGVSVNFRYLKKSVLRVVQLLSDVWVVLCQREINRKEYFNSAKFPWDIKNQRKPQSATFFKLRYYVAFGFLFSIWVRKSCDSYRFFTFHLIQKNVKISGFTSLFQSSTDFGKRLAACHLRVRQPKGGKDKVSVEVCMVTPCPG